MCKVLRIINRFNLGGPTYNAGYLTKYLPENFETKLIGGPNEKSEADSLFILESIGVKGEVIEEMRRSINPINDLRALRKILKIIKEYKPDIVHTHASKAGTLGRLLLGFQEFLLLYILITDMSFTAIFLFSKRSYSKQ